MSVLLIWVTLAGKNFAWGLRNVLRAGRARRRAAGRGGVRRIPREGSDHPLNLFRDRTTTLATLASIAVGVALFGGAVFLGQYFQIARGYSPTAAGLLTVPMVLGSTVSGALSGALITRFGRWKIYLVVGAIAMTVGFGLLATIDHTTNIVLMSGYLFVLGLGMGMTMQNLVLAVQNSVAPQNLGAASSTVTFFRSLGGAAGVSVLGAVLSTHIADLTAKGLAALGITVPEIRRGGRPVEPQRAAAGDRGGRARRVRRRHRPDLPHRRGPRCSGVRRDRVHQGGRAQHPNRARAAQRRPGGRDATEGARS